VYLIVLDLEHRRQLDLDLAHVTSKLDAHVDVTVPRARRLAPGVYVHVVGRQDSGGVRDGGGTSTRRHMPAPATTDGGGGSSLAHSLARLLAYSPEAVLDTHDLEPPFDLELFDRAPHEAHFRHRGDHESRPQVVLHLGRNPVVINSRLLHCALGVGRGGVGGS
jgi:hypothetical protein